MVHVAALLLEGEVVDPLPLLRGAERQQRQDLRLPALEEARAVRARADTHLALDRADLLRVATVGPVLLDRDLAAHDLLVDRLGRALDELAREAVLHLRSFAVDRRGTDRESEVDGLLDPLEEQMPLRGFQLLRVLLRVGQRAEVVAELVIDRPYRRLEPDLVDYLCKARADLRAAENVLLARVHRERRRELVRQLLDDRARLPEPRRPNPLADPVGDLLLQLLRDLGIEVLRFADLAAQVLLRLTEPDDLAVGELERVEQHVLRDLLRARLDHRQSVLRSDDDQVERRVLERRQRRVDDELLVDPADAHCADRSEERHRRDHQRRRGAVDAEDVVRGDHVRREDGRNHLHLVLEALRPERPDRAVDHASGENRALARPTLALEEAAGDLARGVHALLDVDRQREEVRAFARLHPADGRREHHRLARADDDRAVCLLGELAALECDLGVADRD